MFVRQSGTDGSDHPFFNDVVFVDVVAGEVWHEVRTPKGKNLYFFEANSGRSEWELPAGVNVVKEHGQQHLPSTPKAGQSFGFDQDASAQEQVSEQWVCRCERCESVENVENVEDWFF